MKGHVKLVLGSRSMPLLPVELVLEDAVSEDIPIRCLG